MVNLQGVQIIFLTFRSLRLIVPVSVLLILGGCASLGEDHPLNRKFNWFGHLGGADIRQACVAGAPERYRFVYNGIYVEQVRSYDILGTNAPAYHRLKVAVAEQADLTEIITELARPDIFQPWRPRIGSTILSNETVQNMKSVLQGDDFFTSKPPARGISSIEFYWGVSACLDGQFHYNAYVWPSARFRKLAFPALLKSWDKTKIAINRPRKASEYDVYGTYQQEEFRNYFTLHFDNQGVAR
jgi:hypothetical protein